MELYDLNADPGERTNLAQDSRYQVTLQQLNSELLRSMTQAGLEQDSMPIDEGIQSQLPEQSIR